jgi:hypothetical protein
MWPRRVTSDTTRELCRVSFPKSFPLVAESLILDSHSFLQLKYLRCHGHYLRRTRPSHLQQRLSSDRLVFLHFLHFLLQHGESSECYRHQNSARGWLITKLVVFIQSWSIPICLALLMYVCMGYVILTKICRALGKVADVYLNAEEGRSGPI